MYLVNLDLNFSSFPSHITTVYRGGGEIAYRDKKHSVPRVLAAIVASNQDVSFFGANRNFNFLLVF